MLVPVWGVAVWNPYAIGRLKYQTSINYIIYTEREKSKICIITVINVA